ncbi:natural cytotoxicity triggering receptor 3 ligand 1 [Anableps anableps]
MQYKVLVFVVLLALIKHVSANEIEANPNTNATLPCSISPQGDKMDVSLIRVDWTRDNSNVASFEGAEEQIKEGFSWDPSDFTNGDFSLTILRTSLRLQGVYKCRVSYNSTDLLSSNVTFSILAPPSVSVPQKWVLLEKESQLECHARGFYPPPVFFLWTRDEEVIQPPLEVEGEQSPDGYYTAVNNLTFYPSKEDQNVTFSCKVSHRGSFQELDFQLSVTREFVSKQKNIYHMMF